jgi:hypothetical protein
MIERGGASLWYCDEDLSSIYVPVASEPNYVRAFAIACRAAREFEGSRLAYVGKRETVLTDHEAGCVCDEPDCNRRTETCWVFEAVER